MISQVGSAPGAKSAEPLERVASGTKRFISETSEITLDAVQGRLSVVTDRTECFVVSGSDSVRGKAVGIRNHGGFAVVCVSTMDDRPLATSRRMLVIHLTDVQNPAAKFRDATWTTLSDWGRLPHLVRSGAADVRFHNGGQGTPIVRAMRLDEAHAHAMDIHRAADAWTFTAATVQPQGTFLIYDVAIGGTP